MSGHSLAELFYAWAVCGFLLLGALFVQIYHALGLAGADLFFVSGPLLRRSILFPGPLCVDSHCVCGLFA